MAIQQNVFKEGDKYDKMLLRMISHHEARFLSEILDSLTDV